MTRRQLHFSARDSHPQEIVDLCGRLPLAVAIAGGVVMNHGGLDDDLVAVIRADQLRGERDGVTVEERLIEASLRSLGGLHSDSRRRGPDCSEALLVDLMSFVATVVTSCRGIRNKHTSSCASLAKKKFARLSTVSSTERSLIMLSYYKS